MALFKAVVWALIFLTKLRFPPGVSIIAIVLNDEPYCGTNQNKNVDSDMYGNSNEFPNRLFC